MPVRNPLSTTAVVHAAVRRLSCFGTASHPPSATGTRVRHTGLSEFAGAVTGLCVMTWAVTNASALLPNLQLGGVSAGSTVSGIVTLTAQASATGLSSIQFQVSGSNVGPQITSGSCSATWDSRTQPDGARTVTVVGRDSAGNSVTAPAVVVNVKNSTVDTSAPVVSVSSPSSGSVLSGTVTLAASATDNVGVSSVWFTLDNVVIGSEVSSAPFQVSWSTASASNGSHVLRAAARDAAGNATTSASVTITINNAAGGDSVATSSAVTITIGSAPAPPADKAAPTVAMTSPATGANVSGTVTLKATASDNIGVTSVQFLVDGVSIGAGTGSGTYQLSWNTANVSTSHHVLQAVARDAAGNSTTSSSVIVVVSRTRGR